MNGLKTARVGLALALLMVIAGAAPAGAVTAKHRHKAATHHVAKSHAAVGKAGGAKTVSRRHAVKGHTHHRAKAALAEAAPGRRHTQLCRTVTVHHHDVEKCR